MRSYHNTFFTHCVSRYYNTIINNKSHRGFGSFRRQTNEKYDRAECTQYEEAYTVLCKSIAARFKMKDLFKIRLF